MRRFGPHFVGGLHPENEPSRRRRPHTSFSLRFLLRFTVISSNLRDWSDRGARPTAGSGGSVRVCVCVCVCVAGCGRTHVCADAEACIYLHV